MDFATGLVITTSAEVVRTRAGRMEVVLRFAREVSSQNPGEARVGVGVELTLPDM